MVRMMGNWRGKYLDTGPPRGPGHYAEDGHWWSAIYRRADLDWDTPADAYERERRSA